MWYQAPLQAYQLPLAFPIQTHRKDIGRRGDVESGWTILGAYQRLRYAETPGDCGDIRVLGEATAHGRG